MTVYTTESMTMELVTSDMVTVTAAVPGPQGPSGKITDQPLTTANVSGAYTLDVTQNGVYDLTLVGNVSFAIQNNAPAGTAPSIHVILRQDATGGRTITWPVGMRWTQGQPAIGTNANSIYVVSVMVVNGLVIGFPGGEVI